MQYLGLSDNKKLGMVMMIASICLYTFGVVLLCNRLLIILGNISFIVGMYLFIGLKGTIAFLTKKGKLKGSVCYFAGLFFIVVLKMSITGTIIQLIGFFIIFKSFLPDIYDYITKLPYVGKYLKSYAVQNFLDKISTTNNASRI